MATKHGRRNVHEHLGRNGDDFVLHRSAAQNGNQYRAVFTNSVGSATTTAATLTVTAPTLKSIAVTPANPSIAKGATQQFVATGTYSDSSTQIITGSVTWSSTTSTVATITAGGLATGAGVGTSSISATLSGITGSTVLTVTAPTLVSIAVTPASPTLLQGATLQFTATGLYSDGTSQALPAATWSSSNTSSATINSTGLASANAGGTSTISAAFASVIGSTLLTVTASTGTPQISGAALDTGTLNGTFYVDVQYKNVGSGVADSLAITQVTFRTLTGTGTVTYNAASPQLPAALGNLAVGATVTVRYFLNVPVTVVRFTISENGSMTDASGNPLTFGSAQAVTN